MNTRLTYGDVAALLYAIVDPGGNANSLKMQLYMNLACERLMNSGKWKGTIVDALFDASDGYITLPYDLDAALTATYDRWPVPIFSEFHEYVEAGPGEFEHMENAFSGILIDMGDGYCTHTDIEEPGTLRITNNVLDSSKILRIHGLDQNGDEIFGSGRDGLSVTTVGTSVTTSQQFSKVTGILAGDTASTTRMTYPWTLSVVNGATVTEIGSYPPNLQRPMFRRYKTGTSEQAIRVKCHRRFVPFYVANSSQWVYPGNINAIRYALMALMRENAAAKEEAETLWAQAYAALNEEQKTYRGGNVMPLNFSPFTIGGSIPTVN